jgi:hypothetical protein
MTVSQSSRRSLWPMRKTSRFTSGFPAYKKECSVKILKACTRKNTLATEEGCHLPPRRTSSHGFSMPSHQMNAPTTSVTPDMPHPKWKMLGGTAEKVHPPGGAHDGRWLDVIAHG